MRLALSRDPRTIQACVVVVQFIDDGEDNLQAVFGQARELAFAGIATSLLGTFPPRP